MIIEIERTISFPEIAAARFLAGRISLPTLEIGAAPQVRYSDVRTTRFDALGRASSRSSSTETVTRSMAESMAPSIDFLSIARNVFQVELLGAGESPRYDTVDGQIQVNIQEIAARLDLSFSDLENHRFELISRARDRLLREVIASEDRRLAEILGESARGQNVETSIARAIGESTVRGIRPSSVVANARDAVIAFSGTSTSFQMPMRSEETNRMGSIYGMDVYASMNIPSGMMFLLGQPNQTGIMAIRQPLEIRTYDNPSRLSMTIMAHEGVGMSTLNRRAVVPISVEAI